MLKPLTSIIKEHWSCLSGSQAVLNVLIDAISCHKPERDGAVECPFFLITGVPGAGLSALSYQLELELFSEGKNVLSIQRHAQKDTTLFASDLVCSLNLPEKVSVEFKRHKGKSTLDEEYWQLITNRFYDYLIIRDVHEWLQSGSGAAQQSLLGIQELISRCPSIPVAIFGRPGATHKVAEVLISMGISIHAIQLVPMINDFRFEQFLNDVKFRLLSKGEDGAAILASDSDKIYHQSKGNIGTAARLMKLSLADGGAVQFAEPQALKLVLLEPRAGESFSSWMGRLSVEAEISLHFRAIETFASQCSQVAVDPDTLYELPSIKQCFSNDEQQNFTRFKYPPGNYLPFRQSTNYCPECLKADIKEVQLPAWRLAWRRQEICVCCEHEAPVMLLSLSTPHYSPLDKAWRAYCEYVSSPSSRLLVSFPLISNGRQAVKDNEMLLRLAARVQNWILADAPIDQAPRPSMKVVEFLLGVWLCDPSWRTAPGFACSFFFPQRKGNSANLTPDTSFASAPPHYSWATPRQLAVAYWMLGVAFGVVTSDEAELIRDVCRPYSLPFPVDRTEIKRMGLGVHGQRIRDDLIALAQRTLSNEDLDQVIWALA